MRRGPGPLVLVVLLVAACADRGPQGPRWIHLARGFTPPGGAAGFWLRKEIEPASWKPHEERADQWWAPRPETGGYRGLAGEHVEVRLGERLLRSIPPHERRDPTIETGEGLYYLLDDRIVLRLPSGPPAETVELASEIERGAEVGGTWRAPVRNLVADGISVWPGEHAEITSVVPARSVLRFGTVAHPLGEGGKVVFRVTLDGSSVFTREVEVRAGASAEAYHELVLPERGAGSAVFGFEVEGDPAISAFSDPVIGPRDVGSYGDRPWEGARPDVVVFLADTFRADNLEIPGVAPNLAALAARSLRFVDARSPAVWTLPSHGSLFTGVLPTQHGAIDPAVTFSGKLETLAELLATNGYRTGAVTDSGYVSRQYGMDRGFEWFTENEFAVQRLSRTLQEAGEFLARDDGRPVFLFVHTYRVHMPYRQGAEETTEGLDELLERVAGALRERKGQEPVLTTLKSFAGEYHGLYLDAVRALDAQVGPWVAGLEQKGFLRNGLFVFTSDHGEEFYEHDNRGHKGMPHEEKVRVPLFLFGAGMEAGEAARGLGASLVDVPPTIADVCGVPPVGRWVGRSLLRVDGARPAFAYNAEHGEQYLAVVEGERKVFAGVDADGLARGEVRAAFDLEADPGEQVDLAGEGVEWPGEMARSVAPAWAELSKRLEEAGEVDVSEAMRAQLQALGYGD